MIPNKQYQNLLLNSRRISSPVEKTHLFSIIFHFRLFATNFISILLKNEQFTLPKLLWTNTARIDHLSSIFIRTKMINKSRTKNLKLWNHLLDKS